jgi:hypothetical protein
MKKNMRIWRGGSPGSQSVAGAARQRVRSGSAGRWGQWPGARAPGGGGGQQPPGVLHAAARGTAGGGAWRRSRRWCRAAACVGVGGMRLSGGDRRRQLRAVLGGWCG